MGKAKKRSLCLGKHNLFSNLSRDEAVEIVVNSIREKKTNHDLITLFGLSAEELLEGGAQYEDILILENLLK